MTIETLGGPFAGFLLGYLLGSTPFGIVLTRLTGAGDLRAIGSGSIGATNVLRTGRKDIAALTLILDGAKGSAAILLANWLFPGVIAFPALGALLGHLFPIWLRFRGGKGVATFFGIILAYAIARELGWQAPAAYALVWISILLLTRFSSVAGMTAALSAPVAAALLGRFDVALLFLGMALLICWMHRANLDRLLRGTEPRIGRSRDG
ncbi:MAG: glycerol-3-phosphate 1-O-acyltransferase PlsY [Alphaproteobacteria bacterium]|nr:MAG: glycerol-3-phosphate 1-O-acyltransferase PlsY [Alphaproteobacteria bacterium]